MSRHERFLARAASVAEASPHPRWSLGCIVVRGSSVIACAPNVQRNSPNVLEGGPGTSWHAEVNALRKLTYQADRAEGAVLYVVRISRTGKRRLARPCQRCFKAITAAGIKTIVYSLDDEPSFGLEKVYSTV
jgi:deoxycytidylate deaminase